MISTRRTSLSRMKRYCKDPISCIENYELAVNDQVNKWDLHHKDEIDLNKSRKELKEMELYWNCPAERLIFLPHNEHISIHAKLIKESTRKKMSDAHKGKKLKKETKQKMSAAKKGKKYRSREIEVVYNGKTTKYKSIKEAAKQLNISVVTIYNIIYRKHKSRKNLIIRYL